MLHQVIAEHLEAFLGAVAEAGGGVGLPQFVEREFREFLLCGGVRGRRGALSVRGVRAGAPRTIFLQRKGVVSELRGPADDGAGGASGGRGAAVGAGAPMGADAAVSAALSAGVESRAERAVLRVYTRARLDVYRRDARARGIDGGQTGMVTALQRAGGALNANLHFHTLVLDGVFYAPGRSSEWSALRLTF